METQTSHARIVTACQVCGSADLAPVCFVGYLPPVNTMLAIGQRPGQEPAFPAQVLCCRRCQLVQIGLIVAKDILFPPEYAYRSGTTKILRENFAEMYQECRSLLPLGPNDLAVDIGSNDGTLLENFHKGGQRVHGVEPTEVGRLAQARAAHHHRLFRPRGGPCRPGRERAGQDRDGHECLRPYRQHP